MDPKGLKYLSPEHDPEADDYEALDRRFWEGRDPNVPRQLARATFFKVLGQDERVNHVLVSLRDEVLGALLERFGPHNSFLEMARKASAEMRSLNLPLPREPTEFDVLEDDIVFGDDQDVEAQVAALDKDHTWTLTSGYVLSGVGEALNTWAEQHSLRYDWVLLVASETVAGWRTAGMCDLRWSEKALGNLMSYDAPSTGRFESLLPSIQELHRAPAKESREAYRDRINARIDAYCNAQDKFDDEHRLEKSDSYRLIKTHLTWLAVHIVNRTPYSEVEKFSSIKVEPSTIRKGYTKAAGWCGIDLSRNSR